MNAGTATVLLEEFCPPTSFSEWQASFMLALSECPWPAIHELSAF